MALTVDQIIANFPHKAFPVIKGETDYQIIHHMWTLICGNNSTLTTTLGGDNHRHIMIVIWDTPYVTIPPTPYNTPVDSGGGSYSPHTRYYTSTLETTRQTRRIPSHTRQPSKYGRGSKSYGSLSSKYHVWGHWRNIPRIIWCHDMDVLQQQTSKWIKEPSNNPLTHHIQSICSSILLMMGYNMPVRQTHFYLCNKLYKWPIM